MLKLDGTSSTLCVLGQSKGIRNVVLKNVPWGHHIVSERKWSLESDRLGLKAHLASYCLGELGHVTPNHTFSFFHYEMVLITVI